MNKKPSLFPAATSIDTPNPNGCYSALRTVFETEKKKKQRARYRFPYSFDDFQSMLSLSANSIISRRNEQNSFVIDSKNRAVIQQLYCYANMNNKFIGHLHKGLLLVGKYGCGKTLLLEAFSQVYNTPIHAAPLTYPIISFYKSMEVIELAQKNGVRSLALAPLAIDDLGREPKQVVDFGNTRSPMVELLYERYDKGSWTHATSNFSLDTLCSEAFYGPMLGDRFRTMFNVINLPGDSRRT